MALRMRVTSLMTLKHFEKSRVALFQSCSKACRDVDRFQLPPFGHAATDRADLAARDRFALLEKLECVSDRLASDVPYLDGDFEYILEPGRAGEIARRRHPGQADLLTFPIQFHRESA